MTFSMHEPTHGQLFAIGQSEALMGADFAIMTAHYGISLPVLGAAVARYAQDTSARAELRSRLA